VTEVQIRPNPSSEAWDEAERRSLEWLNDRDISGRLREKLLSLVAVADLWDKRDAIEAFVKAMETEAEEDAKDTDDALFIRAVRDLAFDELGSTTVLGDADPWEGLAIPLSDVAERFKRKPRRIPRPSENRRFSAFANLRFASTLWAGLKRRTATGSRRR